MAKVLSIEISNSVIRMCQMDYKKTNPRVYRHAMADTPQGAYMDGRILKPELLKDVIVDAIKENKMSTKDVVFSISSTKIVTREVIIPGIKEKLIPNMIKANLSEYFPIDLSAYEVAHLILEKIEDGADAGKYKVLIMAAEKHMIQSYEQLATSCGLRLVSLDYAGNSIFQAIKNEDESSRVMVLKIEEKSTTVTIVNHKNLMLQRAINYGINDAIDEITKNRVFNVSNYDEAWELAKRKACIKYWINEDAQRTTVDLSTRLETRDFDESQEIREAKIEVTKSLEQLISSIRRVIEFYASRNNGETVDQILIGGCAGDVNGLARLFSNEFGIKTSVMNRLEGVGWHVVGNDAGIYNYVSCIGAALNPIGFYSKEKKAAGEKAVKDYTGLMVVTIFATLIAGVALFYLGYKPYQDALAQEEQLLADKAKYEAAQRTYVAHQNMLTLYEQMLAGDELTIHTNDNILKFFEELEATLPSTVVVESLDSDDEQIVISMSVDDKETAAGVIANIRAFDSLMNVSVPSVSEQEETYDSLDYSIYLYKQYLFEMGNGELFEVNEDGEVINGTVTATGLPIEELKTVEDFLVPATLDEMKELEKALEEDPEFAATFDAESAVSRADLANYDADSEGNLSYSVRRIYFTITGFYYPAVEIMQSEVDSTDATTENVTAESEEAVAE